MMNESDQTELSQLEAYLQELKDQKTGVSKIFFELFRGHKLKLVVAVIALTLQRSPVWIIPIITSAIINIATNQSPDGLRAILLNLVFGLAVVFQNIFSNYAYVIIYSKIIREIEMSLRGLMVKKIQMLSIMFHKEIQSGRLQSKVMRDVENVEVFLMQIIRQLYFVILDIGVAIVVTWMKSPIVLPFFIVVVPVAVFTIRAFRKPISMSNNAYRKEMEETQSKVAEMLTLIPITRAHGLQEVEINKMNSQLTMIKDKGFKLDKLNGLFSSISWVTFQSFQLICLAFTSYLASRGLITIGEVVLYQTYFTLFVGQMNVLVSLYPQMSKSIESIYSISEIVGERDVEENARIVQLGTMKGAIEFRNVSFRYSPHDPLVLDDLCLKVEAGESVAFVGDSGSGKSTILNLLISFMKPVSGSILVDGIHMNNLDIDEFRRQLAVVPQDSLLFSGSIKENIAYGLKGVTDEAIEKVIRDVGLDDLIEKLEDGIYSQLSESAGNLSGGQRQRISIARALLRDPKIIIFDEATSALDSKSEKKVQKATEEMMKRTTTFMVAHRLSTVQNADRIFVVEAGKIVEQGSYKDLMASKGKFYHLKSLQS